MGTHGQPAPFAVLHSRRGFEVGDGPLLDVPLPLPTAEVPVPARPAEFDRMPQAWIEECVLPDYRVPLSIASQLGVGSTSPDVVYFASLTRPTVENEMAASMPIAFLDVEAAIAWARALTDWVQVLATKPGDDEPRYYNASPEHRELPGPGGRPLPPWHS